jgi:LacI family repressor for deo operon, udp, cdd, tsx, nupC, and nupG
MANEATDRKGRIERDDNRPEQPLGRQPTMADVARIAQVSTATVSYLLSGRDALMRRVGAEAQGRIRQAVDQLGYIQNKTARHLRLQRTERLCVLLPRLGIPFADKMAQDIEAVAQRRGFATIVVTASTARAFSRVLHEIESGLADGLIADLDGVIGGVPEEFREPLARLDRTSLMIQADDPIAGPFSVVAHERVPALQQALMHLHGKGHQRVAYVSNHSSHPNPRVDAVNAFVANHPGMAPPILFEQVLSRGTAVERARDIAAMETKLRPTMVLVESDYTAVAMVEEFQRQGLSVPGHMGVIGCGNAEEGYYCNPRLSTLGPVALSMTEATEHLIDLVMHPLAGEPKTFRVPWQLYIRESS